MSKTYLLPLMSELININEKFIDYLENTYLYDSENEFNECLIIQHKFDFRNPEFTKYENEMTNNQYFVKAIDKEDVVYYVFKFPEEYLKEYYFYIDGKYSKFGNDAKQLILSFWEKMYGKSADGINAIITIKHILYKDEKRKKKLEEILATSLHPDAELGEMPIKSNETINLNEH